MDPSELDKQLSFSEWLQALRQVSGMTLEDYAGRIKMKLPNEVVEADHAAIARLSDALKLDASGFSGGFLWEELLHLMVREHTSNKVAARAAQEDCEHDDEFWWRVDEHTINEEGWECSNCGKSLGYRPDLDRTYCGLKVHSILMTMHEEHLIYVSNGTMGEILTDNVVAECREAGEFDQQAIQRFILSDPEMASHTPFWQERAREWLSEHR